MDSEWKFERFHDGSFKSAEDNVRKKYDQFLTDFSHHLDEQIEVLEGYGSNNLDTFFDPIEMTSDSYECTNIINLVNSDNKILNKIVVTFATLMGEVDSLYKEAFNKFIPALSFFGEATPKTEEGAIHVPVRMGQFLPTLQSIMCFVNRSNDVVKHIIQQLTGLYSKSSDDAYLNDIGNLYFEDIYRALSRLFYVLITLDELFTFPGFFQDEWEAYKRILTTAKHDPDVYGLAREKIEPFESLLMNLEGKLMQGQIFINCCIQNFDDDCSTASRQQISKNTGFATIFNRALRHRLVALGVRIDSANGNEATERDEFVGWCGLYGLYVTIFGNADKKLFKDVVALQNRLPAIPIAGNRVWYPISFLKNCLPYLAKFVDSKQMDQLRQRQRTYLQERSGANLAKELAAVHPRLVTWCCRVASDFKRVSDTLAHLCARGALLVEGFHLANRCRLLCQTVLQLHADMKEAITRSLSSHICRGLEMCKVIEAVIRTQTVEVCDYLPLIRTAFADRILVVVDRLKVQIKAQVDKAFSKRQLDILSALTLIDSMLCGSPTRQRISIIQLAFSIVRAEDLLREEEHLELRNNIYHYDILCNFHENIRYATDCTFFFWARNSVFPCYLENLLKNAESIGRLQFTLAALGDAVRSLAVTRLNSSEGDECTPVREYEREVLTVLEERLLRPVAGLVESDLRLQFYSHVLRTRGQLNPFTGSGDVAVASQSNGTTNQKLGIGAHMNLVHFLKCRPIRFFDRHIRIREYVERHLETVFYNLTAIQPSDWRTYTEMRHYVQHQYGGFQGQLCVNVPDLQLPNQSLEQGRDVLNIMRAMAQFSSLYVYNLNTQVFVERRSDNKFLNTVSIRHVANSIRTHGWGIINTTVNNAYVFLKDKFFQFSEFLYDERIKGKLIKELHEHKDRCGETSQAFPFQNAERVRTAIRKMFLYDDGSNPLDRFRIHVTRMGNAMAFVRSVRSGALHCGSVCADFLPPNDDLGVRAPVIAAGEAGDQDNQFSRFQTLAEELASPSPGLLHAAKNVDKVIVNLQRFFVRDTDYFKMFVDVFAPEFRNKKNIHCHNFFILLPALSLSFVDHMMESKEKLNRKNRDVFIFSDDGFAIGVAFILKVLDLYKEFDSLQWFESVYSYYDAKQAELQKSLASASRADENLRQTQTLALRRLEQRKSEFRMLEYGVNSARIFFRADLTAEEERAAQERRRARVETVRA